MRKLVTTAVAGVVLAAPSSVAADPETDTGEPGNPGCFGDFVSTGAQTGLAGEFVRANAQRYKETKETTEESIGNTGVPFLKFLSCPDDYRGRDGPG